MTNQERERVPFFSPESYIETKEGIQREIFSARALKAGIIEGQGKNKCYLVKSPFIHPEQKTALHWDIPGLIQAAGLCQATCFATRHQFKPIVWLHKAELVCKRRESVENGISYSPFTFLESGAGPSMQEAAKRINLGHGYTAGMLKVPGNHQGKKDKCSLWPAH